MKVTKSLVLFILVFFESILFTYVSVQQKNYRVYAVETNVSAISGNLGADGITAQLDFAYPTCSNKPVKVDILYKNTQNSWETHNTCYTNISTSLLYPKLSNCMWKYPLPLNTTPDKLIYRTYKIKNDCSYSTEYVDYHPVNFIASLTYKDYDKVIAGERANYKIKFSTRGGAIYEYYNKRSDSNMNIVHADLGAAMQIAIHAGTPGTFDGCLGQGYYNPTQAGAACQYPLGSTGPINNPVSTTIFNVYCDGVHDDNDSCRSINSNSIILERMMNYDYGSDYKGPYNDADTTSLSQKLFLENDYIKVDISFLDTWGNYRANQTYSSAAVAAPGAFLSNNYNRYYYQNSQGQIIQQDFPVDTGNDAQNFNSTLSSFKGWFITAENPNVPNSAVTIVYNLGNTILSKLTNRGKFLSIVQPNLFDQKLFTLGFDIIYNPTDTYSFSYYIFPYKYNEMVNTPIGLMTVQQFASSINGEGSTRGDLNGDGKVDSTDFDKMVAEFGHPYTIFDYNLLVENFGK